MDLALRRSFYAVYLIVVSAIIAAFIYFAFSLLTFLNVSWQNWNINY